VDVNSNSVVARSDMCNLSANYSFSHSAFGGVRGGGFSASLAVGGGGSGRYESDLRAFDAWPDAITLHKEREREAGKGSWYAWSGGIK